MLRLSIVIPVYDNAAGLAECLLALTPTAGAAHEIIVVDDGSTDDTPVVASSFAVRLLRLERNSGAGTARNHGAREATGDVLLFVDSDVVVAQDTVSRVSRIFEDRPEVAAVFGSYDAVPRAPGLVSQFRNLLHYFVHQQGDPEASTFWAGCGAIRRSVFEEAGGFDAGPYTRAIEDIELGYRLRDAGHRILLDKDLRVTHLKRWTLASFVRTDLLLRAVPWSRLILDRRSVLDHLNLKVEHRVSVALALLMVLALALAALTPPMLVFAAAASLGLLLANRRLLAFFARSRGIAFAVATIPLLFIHYLASGLGYLWVRAGHAFARAVS
ncbi:MAG TPA: glycosyltransferase [Thermoanaerobaculia bacterium]|jgi:GT2 family glycosyltransferase|nr:glycosyltransferase [Thermoanaerobaculia bacterium]